MSSRTLSVYALSQINPRSHPDSGDQLSRTSGQTSSIPRTLLTAEALAHFHSNAPTLVNPSFDSSPINNAGDDPLVPLGSRIVHKFYEPVILLASLIDVVKPRSGPIASSPNPTLSAHNPDFQSFKAFVNKLSHICSSFKGRETVTSFVVLRDSPTTKHSNGRIHYWFATNDENHDQLVDTKAYVENILGKVARAPSKVESAEASETVRKEIHRDVLVFNRPRISCYLRDMQVQVVDCLERCARNDTTEDQAVSEQIMALLDSENVGAYLRAPESDYISKVQSTIRLLRNLERSPIYPTILSRAEEGRLMPGSSHECFSEFLHTSNRIIAYPQSVQYILTVARIQWPELFTNNPIVSFLPSSKAIPRPYRQKSLTAESIVNRMTRKDKEIVIFKDFVKRLQVFDLDDRIKNEYSKESFSPIVHSEVLLLNWLWMTRGGATDRRIDSSVFFNGWMYIGSSKPTCRLCHYYFEERRSGVRHRDDWHGNLYPGWAFPEVLASQGEAAVEDRQIMVDRVLLRVRKEAFEVVRKKIAPKHKEEDSNTFSEGVTLEDRWTIQLSVVDPVDEVDEITSMMGEMGTDDHDDHGYDEESGGVPLVDYQVGA